MILGKAYLFSQPEVAHFEGYQAVGHTVSAEQCWLSALTLTKWINESSPDNQRPTYKLPGRRPTGHTHTATRGRQDLIGAAAALAPSPSPSRSQRRRSAAALEHDKGQTLPQSPLTCR